MNDTTQWFTLKREITRWRTSGTGPKQQFELTHYRYRQSLRKLLSERFRERLRSHGLGKDSGE